MHSEGGEMADSPSSRCCSCSGGLYAFANIHTLDEFRDGHERRDDTR